MGGQHCLSHSAMGAVSGGAFFTMLPLALLLLPAVSVNGHGEFLSSPLNCHKTCVCASNIVSCSKMNLTVVPLGLPRYTALLDLSFNTISRLQADWTPVKLSRLHSLLLSHNGLDFLSSEAFLYVTRLRYLDLSSNGLKILEELIFEPLEHLEVLLLYNNHISQIDRTAFSGLLKIQKIYLSQNQISRFPLELVKERNRQETLTLLDVSSNRIKNLPLHELNALPAWLKNGLFFQNNPLPCSCELYEMVARWHLQELGSAVDFRDDHTCLMPGPQKERLVTLDLNKVHLNCSEVNALDREVFLDQFLILDCDVRQKHMRKNWVLPPNIPSNATAKTLRDGSLQIGPLKAEDSGVYTCYATSDTLNETVYVTVAVHNFTKTGGLESMKTAYTTLVGCLVSIVMILLYLFLTPCNCICCPNQGLSKGDLGDSLHSSTVSISQMHDNLGQDDNAGASKAFLSRRVSFLDPKDQLEQNGRLNPIGEEEEEWQGDSRGRRKSDADSVSSVSSDTPMVV